MEYTDFAWFNFFICFVSIPASAAHALFLPTVLWPLFHTGKNVLTLGGVLDERQIMWFAISPVMTQVVKPKCAAADSDVCKACFVKYPNDNVKYFRDDNGTPINKPPVGAKDAKCRKCYPNDGRKGAGCGGVGLTPNQAKNSTMVGISGKHINTHIRISHIRISHTHNVHSILSKFTYTYMLYIVQISLENVHVV